MDKRGKIFIFLIILLVTAVLTWGVSFLENYRPSTVLSGRPLSSVSITDFESCAAAGYPVMESYPEQCRTPDGQTFTRDIGNELEKSNLIKVFKPRPSEEVISPLQITGEARGFWYFEAIIEATTPASVSFQAGSPSKIIVSLGFFAILLSTSSTIAFIFCCFCSVRLINDSASSCPRD